MDLGTMIEIFAGVFFGGIIVYKSGEAAVKKIRSKTTKSSTKKVVNTENTEAIHLGLLDIAQSNGLTNKEWYKTLSVNKPISEEEFNHYAKVKRAQENISKKDEKRANKKIKV